MNIADLRAAARSRLPRALFEYVDRGAEDEVAVRSNRAAIERLKLRPRVLRGVAARSAQGRIFGAPTKLPIAVAPTAVAGLLWHDGDVQSALAAVAEGIPFTLSTYSVTTLERVAQAAAGGRLWFQLYAVDDRDHLRSLVLRARDAGYEALVLTVDGVVAPKREYNARNGFSIPIRPSIRLALDVATHPRWLLGVLARYQLTTGVPGIAHAPAGGATSSSGTSRYTPDAGIDWDTVRRIRDLFPGKLILKGILHPADAALAAVAGVDGIVVSNHGGRNLDASIAPIEALPEVVAAVGGKLSVMVDGAFNRGSDIVKALALGACAVYLGRSILWGAAAFGGPGVRHAIGILGDEIDRVLGQVGVRSIDALSADILWRAER